MRFKFTVFFERSGVGWSESWYTSEGSQQSCIRCMETYMTLRQQMLPNPWTFQGLRAGRTQLDVSEGDGKDPLRQSQVYYPGIREFETGPLTIKIPSQGTYVSAGNVQATAIPNICLQERVTFDSNRATSRYLVGIPTLAIVDTPGGDNLSLPPLWQGYLDRLEIFAREAGGPDLGGPLFIKARVGSVINANTWPVNAWGIVAGAPSNVFFITESARIGSLTIGDRVHIRNTKIVPSVTFGGSEKQQQMNGSWNVVAINPGVPSGGFAQVVLGGTAGIPADRMKVYGTWQRVRFRLYQVQNMKDVRLRTHKRGKATLVSRGRRLSRTNLDP